MSALAVEAAAAAPGGIPLGGAITSFAAASTSEGMPVTSMSVDAADVLTSCFSPDGTLIAAGEDIGLADPNAIVIVESCAAAFDRIGLPEGVYPLAQATLYLASTEKSNSVKAIFKAVQKVKDSQKQNVPSHLKDANRDQEAFGDGLGYSYPHSFSKNWVPQQYLPDSLLEEIFWKPTEHGWEGERRSLLNERRSEQLASLVEVEQQNPLTITSGKVDNDFEKFMINWLP